jgi:guanine deaminase
MIEKIVRGPLLIPLETGGVGHHADGAIAIDHQGRIAFAGAWEHLLSNLPQDAPKERISRGVILPPLLDLHTHIPQHPIRGRFLEGVNGNEPHGRLLAGLARNVFPAEIKCNAGDYARKVIEAFAADVLTNGIVGGATYMTVSSVATELALEILPPTWSVGLVAMNQNCPVELRTDEANFRADIERIAARFGRRLIVTDRFAVATTSPLRQACSRLAGTLGLRTQTHLNEQIAEKNFVERELYPHAASYTDVYFQDGLLNQHTILAHCNHMRLEEWKMLASAGAAIAHCPTSNFALDSGFMSLDEVMQRQIPYAIATDVGASSTVSMLAEMKRFIQVHEGRSAYANASEALWRATLAPARILGLEQTLGRLEPGRPASFIEARRVTPVQGTSADDLIHSILPMNIDDPERSILRVTMNGKTVFEDPGDDA